LPLTGQGADLASRKTTTPMGEREVQKGQLRCGRKKSPVRERKKMNPKRGEVLGKKGRALGKRELSRS